MCGEAVGGWGCWGAARRLADPVVIGRERAERQRRRSELGERAGEIHRWSGLGRSGTPWWKDSGL